ncbi:MAG: cobalt transporter CbiM [Deltaproteobacteria bacterium]|jgi:cobalt/nickel transport system permease protein|nr:cobalt transporter CbiM [Deltaproteobacteria bacterium]
MHISEGVLTIPVLAAGGVISALGVAMGLAKIKSHNLPQAAILTAAFFTASFIHVNIGPSSVHLMINGLIGLLMGWMAFPIILVGLTLQALLFQFGGITVLGVNTFNVAGPAVLFGFLFRKTVLSDKLVPSSLAAAGAGFFSIALTALLVGVALYASNPANYGAAAKTVFVAHIPVMVIEAIITLLVVRFLKKVKPEILFTATAVRTTEAV